MAAIDWDAAITAQQARELPCSGGERPILLLSASLAADTLVGLGGAVTGIDDANISRPLTAIRHAAEKDRDQQMPIAVLLLLNSLDSA